MSDTPAFSPTNPDYIAHSYETQNLRIRVQILKESDQLHVSLTEFGYRFDNEAVKLVIDTRHLGDTPTHSDVDTLAISENELEVFADESGGTLIPLAKGQPFHCYGTGKYWLFDIIAL